MPSVTFRSFSSVPYFLCSELPPSGSAVQSAFPSPCSEFLFLDLSFRPVALLLGSMYPDGWIFIKESSRQSSFLHQLWNADMFFICQHILYCLQCQFNFLFTFSLIFLNHLVVFAHILLPIRPDLLR